MKTRWIVVVALASGLAVAGAAAYLRWRMGGTRQVAGGAEDFMAESGRPLPCGPDVHLWKEQREREERLIHRLLVEIYPERGIRDDRWDAAATGFLGHMEAHYLGDPAAPSEKDLIAEGRALVEGLGCTDPVVLACLGGALQDSDAPEDAGGFLQEAFKAFAHTDHPALLKRNLAARMTRLHSCDSTKDEAATRRWASIAVRKTIDALRDGSYQRGEERLAVQQILRDWDLLYDGHVDELLALLRDTPGLDPWVADCAAGKAHIVKAWEARGSGWAYEVTEEGWRDFRENLKMARKCLVRAWRSHPERPEAPALMIDVVMGGEGRAGETIRVWFDRAIAAEFDYLPAYRSYMHALLPRWGGSLDAQYAFARACAETRRFDTDVPLQLYRVFVKMDVDAKGAERAWRRPDAFGLLKGVFDGYVATTKGARQRVNRAMLVVSAWRCDRFDEACRLLQRTDDLDMDALQRELGMSTNRIHTLAAGRGGPWAAEIAAAEASAVRDPEGAVASMGALLGRPDLDAPTRAYVNHRLALIGMQRGWRAGEWVPLDIPPDGEGWSLRSGVWTMEDDGGLRGSSSSDGMMLVSDAVFEGDLEMQGDLAWGESPYLWRYNGGFLFGFAEDTPDEYASMLLFKHESVATLQRRAYLPEHVTGSAAQVAATNHLRLKIASGRATATINGVEAFACALPKDFAMPRRYRVGVGGAYWYPGASITFRNVSVRRLPPGG